MKIAIVFVALILVACGNGKSIEGTYVSNLNGDKFTFGSDGTFVHANASRTFPIQKYTIEGDAILIDGTHIGDLKVLANGNISSAAGLLEKQQ
ncbi:hypothetical protein [Cupriavidus pinatubonensis]|uniref:Lipoprotein n=1 Tax=Cupriavidus pinatubonensis TaxID=248026 RepID=A0ABM8WSG5_9BURK|nr:hypothetical protein [Cupriavidus pinatubonensis]CAG9170401.1 hypothetical protein LMG23994_01881 [Cupriavidus pinatubonensis]